MQEIIIVGELRIGLVEIELYIPELGFDINVAEIILTECETVNQFQDQKLNLHNLQEAMVLYLDKLKEKL